MILVARWMGSIQRAQGVLKKHKKKSSVTYFFGVVDKHKMIERVEK